MRTFRETLFASVFSAVVAVIAEIVAWITIFNDRTWMGITAGWVTLACCLSCAVLFVIALFRFRLKGLWLALPAVVDFQIEVANLLLSQRVAIRAQKLGSALVAARLRQDAIPPDGE